MNGNRRSLLLAFRHPRTVGPPYSDSWASCFIIERFRYRPVLRGKVSLVNDWSDKVRYRNLGGIVKASATSAIATDDNV